ncbi:MAG TPA: hypothetical protein VGR73_00890 [Bryobacteraceae bacterium]|nr:hypothetical protein [Bryobacteraceae bacterium]
MYTDSLLNWGWTSICLAAFTWFLISAWKGRLQNRRANFRQAIALGLALVSLFPCISASDDSARLKNWSLPGSQDSAALRADGSPHTDNDMLTTLVRLLEVLEACQAAVTKLFSLFLTLFALMAALRLSRTERVSPWRAGRSPPAACLAF